MPKWLATVIATCLCLASGGALAGAPQILALIETPAPVPLACEVASCRAELSAFCLQQASQAPGHGTPYVVAGSGSLDLILRDAEGKQRRVPAIDHLEIASVRGYAAVSVGLSRQRLTALGATSALVAVGKEVSLLPRSLAAERDVTRDPDVALATGTWRRIGSQVVEAGGAAIDAVRATNALINLLPGHDPTRQDSSDALWRTAVAGTMANADPAGLAVARSVLDECTQRLRYLGAETVQMCLQLRHDVMMEGLTREYWNVVGTGS